MFIFPRKAWLIGQKHPVSVFLEYLYRREFLKCRSEGFKRSKSKYCAEIKSEYYEKKYNLIRYDQRASVSSREWIEYVKLNSFTKTRKAAYQMEINWQKEIEDGKREFRKENY